MVACLAAVPVLLLGTIGWIGQPVDVISAPGANVAIALGIDAMIHLLMAVRRRRRAGEGIETAWIQAAAQQRPAIVGAMSILAAGFAIFVVFLVYYFILLYHLQYSSLLVRNLIAG